MVAAQRLANRIRIIGGRWRGRQLRFIPIEGLRPTPDRVRETLFNWLTPLIQGARCLDLFAGSGALGIEALSRGAAEVVFVERHPAAAQRLLENLILLDIEPRWVEQADALTWIRNKPQAFDVIFLDPPFGERLVTPACACLELGWLTPNARIYLETELAAAEVVLPSSWRVIRKARAGQVAYCLAVRE